MSTEAPWETIRRAASRLEELAQAWRDGNVKAEKLAAGSWRESRAHGLYTWGEVAAFVVDDYCDEALEPAKRWIAILSPAVAEPLVKVLFAISGEMKDAGVSEISGRLVMPDYAWAALDFSRRVLGEEADRVQ